ncbi:MAG: hypothetical protein EA379_01830, partial [Phycisphaerales bacterium]
AQASLALPGDANGDRWRRSVAPIVGLQAVVFALADTDELPDDERALGLDRADVLIRAHAADLHEAWRAEPMPPLVAELIDDARAALAAQRSRGTEWVVAVDRLETPDLHALLRSACGNGWTGDALGATRGTVLFRGEPVLHTRPHAEINIEGCERVRRAPPRQVFRQVDDATGRVVRDLVAPLGAPLPPGRPLLVTLAERGVPAPPADEARTEKWRESQRRALPEGAPPIEHWAEERD